MTRAEQIRAVLKEAGRPMTCAEVVREIPGIETHHAIGVMYRDGILSRTGKVRAYAYAVAREPLVRPKLAPHERKARKAARERVRGIRRRQENGGRSLAVWRAEQAAQKVATAERRQAEKLALREERQRERAARRAMPKPERPKPALKAPKPKPHQHIVISPSTRFERAEPPKPVLESVNEYLKRGGRIERLPMHAVSQPLRRIA